MAQISPSRARDIASLIAIVLACAVLAGVGSWIVRVGFTHSVEAESKIDAARIVLDDLRVSMLAEDIAVRGYAVTGERNDLRGYRPEAFDRLYAMTERDLQDLGIGSGLVSLRSAKQVHDEWERTVATPIVRAPRGKTSGAEIAAGTRLLARFERDWASAAAALEQRNTTAASEAARRLQILLGATAFGALLFLTVVLTALRWARRAARERETNQRLALAFGAPPLPENANVALSAVYIPSYIDLRVGGDWYEVVPLPDGKTLVAMGDVIGHGIDAAVATSRLRQLALASSIQDDDPASVLRRVNVRWLEERGPIATLIVALYNPSDAFFLYASAGHPPPVLRGDGAPQLLPYGGPPLGIEPYDRYETIATPVPERSLIVMYTDGVIEQKRDDVYGERELLSAIAAVETDENVAESLFRRLFRGARPSDDVTVVAFSTALSKGDRQKRS
jgi:CHASE3 domain sensor protein